MNNMTIIDNLMRIRKLVSDYPEENIYLDRFCVQKSDCGTLYCVAGLMASDPYFQNMGFHLRRENPESPTSPLFVFYKSRFIFDMDNDVDVSADIFGQGAYRRLFEQRGDGLYDGELLSFNEDGVVTDQYDDVSDKRLAIYRIDRRLAELSAEAIKEIEAR